MLCFLSDVGTPRLLSLPRSVHRTGDQILSFTARRALFLLPSKKEPHPFSGPPGSLTKSMEQRQRVAMEKPNPTSDLSRSPLGTPSCCQQCLGWCEPCGMSLPFSSY